MKYILILILIIITGVLVIYLPSNKKEEKPIPQQPIEQSQNKAQDYTEQLNKFCKENPKLCKG